MKTKNIEVCDAKYIDVSCEYNDPVDIRCGGPAVLGYDFYVSPDENDDDIRKFIIDCLRKYRRKYIGISIRKKENYPVDRLWTKEKIGECIKNNSI